MNPHAHSSDTPAPIQLALVQMDPQIGQNARNRDAMLALAERAAHDGGRVILFPECALSGYVFDDPTEAAATAEPARGESVEAFERFCRGAGCYVLFGLLESTGKPGEFYNCVAFVGPSGLIAVYRKCHLPVLGVDRFVASGDCLSCIDIGLATIGPLICYDIRFPEAARTLALQGADLLALPTNWPEGAESAPKFLCRARAWENRVYLAACNRVGTERGVRFIGRSQIVGPNGDILAEADGVSETILHAEIDPAKARQKKIVIEPGVFELDPVGRRRPELYTSLLHSS